MADFREQAKREATIGFLGDRVVKRQHPKLSRIELRRTRLGAQIAEDCGLFDVPEILSHNDDDGELVFAYVDQAKTLGQYLRIRPDMPLMKRVGQALGCIHELGVASCGRDVFWHGDYGVGNVLYSEASDRITVIDWANAKWVHEPPERSCGRAGFDLGLALIALFHSRPFGRTCIPRIEALAASFLEGYVEARRHSNVREELAEIPALIRRRRQYWISQRGLLKNTVYDLSLLRLRLFLLRSQSRLR